MAPSPQHVQEEELPLPDPSESVFGRRIPENGPGSAVFEVSSGVATVPQPDKRAPLAPQQLSQAEKIIELPAVADRPRPGESVEEHAGKPSHASVSRVPHVTQAAQQKPETPLGPPPHLLGQIPVLVEATPPPSVGNRHGASTREPTPPQANPGPAADPFTAVFEALNQKLTSQPPSRPTRFPGPSDDYYYYYDDYDDDYYYYDYDYPRRQIGPQRGRFRFPATNPRQPTFAGVSQRRVPFAAASLPRQPPAGQYCPHDQRPAALTRPAPRVQPRPITPPPSLFATQAPVRTPARHDEALEGAQVQPHQGFPSRAEAQLPQLPSSQGGAQVPLEAPVAPGLPSSKPNPTSSTVFKMTASPHPSEALGRPDDPPSTLPPRPIPPPSLQQQPPPPPAKTRPQFQDTGSPKSQSEELSASGPPLRAPELPPSDQGEALEPRIQGAPVYFLPPEATLPELATQIRRRRRPDARVGGPEGGSWQNQTPTSSPQEPREGRKDSPTRESTSPQEETAISPPAGPQPPPTAARLQAPQESIPERDYLHDNNAFSSRHNISEDSAILQGVSPSKRFPESQDTDPQRPERGRRPQFSRLPLVGFTGAQALGDYAEPEDASSQKDEATPPGAPEIEREIPNSHVQEQANRPAGATPHDSPRGEGPASPHDGILEGAAPFDESIIANHDGESVPEVQGWRKDLPYPNITIPVESPALSGLPFYISGKKDLGPFFIVALD
nr:vegetative cell wall protein gp1-like [Penaeus vannamei]